MTTAEAVTTVADGKVETADCAETETASTTAGGMTADGTAETAADGWVAKGVTAADRVATAAATAADGKKAEMATEDRAAKESDEGTALGRAWSSCGSAYAE